MLRWQFYNTVGARYVSEKSSARHIDPWMTKEDLEAGLRFSSYVCNSYHMLSYCVTGQGW